MQNKLVDMHCHLDLLKHIDFNMLKNVNVLSMTTTPAAWTGNKKLFSKYDNVKIALGFHPQLINERSKDFSLFEYILPETKYVGEVGLDGSIEYKNYLTKQKDIFESILKLCSKNNGKILSIHSRRAIKETLDLLEKYPNAGKFILHWFSGTISELERAIQLGCWFSINNSMLSNKKGTQLIQSMPLNKILTETDIPFNKLNNNIYAQLLDTLNKLKMLIPAISDKIILNNFQNII